MAMPPTRASGVPAWRRISRTGKHGCHARAATGLRSRHRFVAASLHPRAPGAQQLAAAQPEAARRPGTVFSRAMWIWLVAALGGYALVRVFAGYPLPAQP